MTGKHVRIATIKLKPHRSRSEPTDPAELAARNERRKALAESWLENPINDIIARDGDYAVGDGNERVAGLLLIGTPEITVWMIPADTTDAQLDEMSLLTDFHKNHLKPVERAKLAIKLKESSGMSQKELSAKLRVSEGLISKLLTFRDCIPAVQAAAEAGKIGLEDWYMIAPSPNQEETLRLKLSGEVKNRAELKAASKNGSNKKGKDQEDDTNKPELNTIRIPQPGNITVTIAAPKLKLAGCKAILDTAARMTEKALADGLQTRSAMNAWKDISKKPKAAPVEKKARKKKEEAQP